MSMATSTAIGLGLGVAGIGSSIATGIVGSNAAKDATNAQVNAANHAADLQSQAATNALNFQKQQYGNSLNLLSPFYNTGVSANGRLAFLMGLNPGQGLPPGVVNPNAPPPTSQPGALDGGSVDTNALAQLRALRGGGRNVAMPQNSALGMPQFGPGTPNGQPNGTQFNMNPPITSPGTNGTQFQMRPPIVSGGTQGSQFQMNPPITSGGTQGAQPGGAAGLLGANGQPQTEANPLPNGLGTLPQGVTNGSTNQGGTGQVPQTGNSLALRPPSNVTGEAMFNPNDPNQGLTPDGSAPNGGAYGSLAQGWGKTFSSPTANDMTIDPGYKFRLDQGTQALQNSAAARGGLLSGGTAKALNDYAQGSASGEYGNVYNRALQNYNTNYNTFTNDQTNLFNRLAALSGQGQVTANNLSSAGLNFANNSGQIGIGAANNIGQDYQNIGAAQASGYNNGATAVSNSITGATAGTLQLLKLLQQQGGSGGGGGSSSGGWGAY